MFSSVHDAKTNASRVVKEFEVAKSIEWSRSPKSALVRVFDSSHVSTLYSGVI